MMELEQALKIADGEYATPAKRSEAARTLAAEVRRLAGAVPAGHVRDDKGVDRQVLGTLVTTDDGAVIGNEAVVVDLFGDVHICYASHEEPCYSTKEAAEAARERGKA